MVLNIYCLYSKVVDRSRQVEFFNWVFRGVKRIGSKLFFNILILCGSAVKRGRIQTLLTILFWNKNDKNGIKKY